MRGKLKSKRSRISFARISKASSSNFGPVFIPYLGKEDILRQQGRGASHKQVVGGLKAHNQLLVHAGALTHITFPKIDS